MLHRKRAMTGLRYSYFGTNFVPRIFVVPFTFAQVPAIFLHIFIWRIVLSKILIFVYSGNPIVKQCDAFFL